MLTQFLALMRTNLRLFLMDRRAVMMSVVAPIAIASFFGYIFGGGAGNTDDSQIPIFISDQDNSPLSKAIFSNMAADKALDVKPATPDAARQAVQKGKISAALVIPAGFSRQMMGAFFGGASKPPVDILYDPSRSIEMRVVQGILSGAAMRAMAQQLPARAGMPSINTSLPFDSPTEAITSNRGTKYNGYAHSFGGMGIQFLLMVGVEVGVSLLLVRQTGVWKRMRAAPLSRSVLLGSRVAASALTSMITLVILFAFARVVFGVRIEGSLAGFLCVCLAFSLMTSVFGLLVASLGNTPEGSRPIAILATLFLVMLGGAWVPTFVFPRWLQNLTVWVPTRWAMDGLDGVTWRGLGFESVVTPVALMLACTLVLGAIAVVRFRWESD